MKIVLTLKNGLILEWMDCTANDFEEICNAMRSLKRFLTWNEKMWVRKSEVSSFELIELPKDVN